MLLQIDTAIGFAVAMLLLSLLITATVQVLSAIFDIRGRNLRWGVAKILQHLLPLGNAKPKTAWESLFSRNDKEADRIADCVIRHPSITNGANRAHAVRLDELMKVLEDLASDHPVTEHQLEDELKNRLRQALAHRVAGGAETV